MSKYLRDAFARNKPYDRMVYELVTASGSTKAGTANFNGATNFLVMKVNEEMAVQATAAVSKVFLGLQVQCTQCHNHPFNQWKQQKFWEFNAFFRQTRALRRFVPGGRDIDHAELNDNLLLDLDVTCTITDGCDPNTTNGNDVIDVDDLLNGHGTQVAGIIAAEKNNDGIGMQGIAPRAKIIPIRAIGVTDGSDILGIQ
jgi:hypothetical protein